MASRFSELVLDSHEPRKLADFWSEVLGYKTLEENDEAVEIGAEEPTAEGIRQSPVPPTLVFVPVPEDKVVKNRMHIDVSPIDCTQAEEVERMLALGATHVDVGQGEQPWVVLADPEGNEFCVLRSLASPNRLPRGEFHGAARRPHTPRAHARTGVVHRLEREDTSKTGQRHGRREEDDVTRGGHVPDHRLGREHL